MRASPLELRSRWFLEQHFWVVHNSRKRTLLLLLSWGQVGAEILQPQLQNNGFNFQMASGRLSTNDKNTLKPHEKLSNQLLSLVKHFQNV